MMLGSHLVKTSSTTQSAIALSSSETEYYALVKAAAQGLGTKAIVKNLRVKEEEGIEVKSDASAAIGIAQRRATVKVRHIEVNQLWLQEKVANGAVKISRPRIHENLADQLTKPVTAERMKYHLEKTHQKIAAGRQPLAPNIAS